MENKLQIFENKKIRSAWDKEKEEWYFSVTDVVEVLTESSDPRQYLKRLKSRDPELLSNWGTICTPVPMEGLDGKKRKILGATVEGLFRLIQTIPSPKAEPIKQWLAKVGSERVQEYNDPETAIERAKEIYLAKGYPIEWINQRILGIQVRNKLTDEWKSKGIKDRQYGILTDIIHRSWTGLSVKEHKELKGLKKENLRDNMTTMEVILTMLAEETTTEISKSQCPSNFVQHKKVAKAGGLVANRARVDVEKQTGRKVVSRKSAKDFLSLERETFIREETEEKEPK